MVSNMIMASNMIMIKLSLGSLLFFLVIACTSNSKNTANVNVKKKRIDTCIYYNRYDAHQIVSNLGCQNCHVPYGDRMSKKILTFSELSTMDSLKLVDYTFTKKHKGWFSKTGPCKDAKMDTLSDCEIRNAIRYIKDSGRNIPVPSQ